MGLPRESDEHKAARLARRAANNQRYHERSAAATVGYREGMDEIKAKSAAKKPAPQSPDQRRRARTERRMMRMFNLSYWLTMATLIPLVIAALLIAVVFVVVLVLIL